MCGCVGVSNLTARLSLAAEQALEPHFALTQVTATAAYPIFLNLVYTPKQAVGYLRFKAFWQPCVGSKSGASLGTE